MAILNNFLPRLHTNYGFHPQHIQAISKYTAKTGLCFSNFSGIYK
jgi:hypothetical protein